MPWTEVSSERDGHALGETTGLTRQSADHQLRPLQVWTAEPLAAVFPACTPVASLAHGHKDILFTLTHPGLRTAVTSDLEQTQWRGTKSTEL